MLSSFLQCNPYYSLQLTRNWDPRYRRNPIMAALITLGGQAWLRSRIDDADRNDEVIAAADEHGIAMVMTGERHFRH